MQQPMQQQQQQVQQPTQSAAVPEQGGTVSSGSSGSNAELRNNEVPSAASTASQLSPQQLEIIERRRQEALAKKHEREASQKVECVVCKQPMLLSEERLALPCAHTFHTICITRYAKSKGFTLQEACPMRCHRSLIAKEANGSGSSGSAIFVDLVNNAEVAAANLI